VFGKIKRENLPNFARASPFGRGAEGGEGVVFANAVMIGGRGNPAPTDFFETLCVFTHVFLNRRVDVVIDPYRLRTTYRFVGDGFPVPSIFLKHFL
jgi:hypothetical protein